jgi:hypothetical protein
MKAGGTAVDGFCIIRASDFKGATERILAKYRGRLPQLSGKPFLTDGGLETTLIFHNKLELPYFAAFDLLKDDSGCAVLREYFKP